jgi:glutathione S-transferase
MSLVISLPSREEARAADLGQKQLHKRPEGAVVLRRAGHSLSASRCRRSFRRQQSPEYLRLNPNGLVPTIADGGFVLWEATVIVRYRAAKHGIGPLCPEDLTERTDADRWMDWQMGTLCASFRPAFIGLVRASPEDRDEARIEAAIGKTGQSWSIRGAHLSGRNYVTGPSFTMADVPLGATAYRWFSLDIERPSLLNLEA